MKTIEIDRVKILVPEGDENMHEKAKRIASEEIKKAGCAPHSAHAAILHMKILRALLTPQTEILTPAVAQAVMAKRDQEAAHRSSSLSFIREEVSSEDQEVE
jgi:hypothetical protein